MSATKIDLLINCRWIIPIVPDNQILEHCAIAIQDERILGIYPQVEAEKRFEAIKVEHLDNHVVMPGLINAHGHAAMTLLRGYADDLPLRPWLEDHIWPAESRHLSEEFVRDGTELAMAEMIASGTTCFADMYFYHEAIAEAVRNAGMRCQIGFTVLDFPTPYGRDANDYIHKGLALNDKYSGHPLLKIACAPHAPYSVSDPAMQVIATYANELDMAVHIHCHETAQEVSESLAEHGCRPLERLNNLGLLLPQTQLVHMTQTSSEDIRMVKDHNSHVVHCPETNMKLASGNCPVAELLDAGVNTALGTDGAASNNDLDLFSELKTAALLAKSVSGNAAALDAHAALRMATINGAKALGWEAEIGSLEAGKSADLIAVQMDSIAQQPLYNPASQLVYTNTGDKVTHSWVAGKPLLIQGQLQTMNRQSLIQTATDWRNKIAS
jgi:5-methylthioadenosine/S-adenosylhomocysteine deaminase